MIVAAWLSCPERFSPRPNPLIEGSSFNSADKHAQGGTVGLNRPLFSKRTAEGSRPQTRSPPPGVVAFHDRFLWVGGIASSVCTLQRAISPAAEQGP